ncbi:hypothetical protein Nepgr_018407 [Nepenthes gracilis]|uniref:Uncharacterized protein n=1 Tax=Nepenthes gracilis TaxID=150966 RepID=A0AAD3SUU0_NEPGR|nr:hypothetical protein Nepgr_018407 [Nepenthes gracilis]
MPLADSSVNNNNSAKPSPSATSSHLTGREVINFLFFFFDHLGFASIFLGRWPTERNNVKCYYSGDANCRNGGTLLLGGVIAATTVMVDVISWRQCCGYMPGWRKRENLKLDLQWLSKKCCSLALSPAHCQYTVFLLCGVQYDDLLYDIASRGSRDFHAVFQSFSFSCST